MDTVLNLLKKRFKMYNLLGKIPARWDKNQKKLVKMTKWNKLSFEQLQNHHRLDLTNWGMLMGLHEANGRRILCLDFDVWNDKRQCLETQKQLDEFLEGLDEQDGCFYTGTEGNFNILVDYTDDTAICQLVDEETNDKFKIHELEVHLRTNVAIPPTQSICKRSQKLSKPRAFLTDEPFYVITDNDDCFVQDFIKNLFKIYRGDKKPKINNKKTVLTNTMVFTDAISPVVDPVTTPENPDKWMKLLFDVIKNDYNQTIEEYAVNYKRWVCICSILKSNGYDEKFWTQYCGLAPQRDGFVEKQWNYELKGSWSVHGLEKIARKVNLSGYQDWFGKNKAFLSIKLLFKGENDVARYLAPMLRDEIKYCKSKWWMFNGEKWICGSRPDAKVISFLQKLILSSITSNSMLRQTANEEEEEKCKKRQEDYEKFYRNANKASNISQLFRYFEHYLRDDDFEDLLDTNIYSIAFQDGLLCLKTLHFRKGFLASDYISNTIAYPYAKPSLKELDFVKYEIRKICNCNDYHMKCILMVLGMAFCGDAQRIQKFWTIIGQKASNGKTLIFNALNAICPHLVVKLDQKFYLTSFTTRHKSIPTLKNALIAYVNDQPDKVVETDVLKDFRDAGYTLFPKMYGESERLLVKFKVFIISNYSMRYSVVDNGLTRSAQTILLDSVFKEEAEKDDFETRIFKANLGLAKEMQTTYKYALLDLIFSYSKQFCDKNYTLFEWPADWTKENSQVMNDNDPFRNWFDDNFQLGPESTHSITREALDEVCFQWKDKFSVRDKLKSYNIAFRYECDEKRRGATKKGVYYGFKYIEPVKDDNNSTTGTEYESCDEA